MIILYILLAILLLGILIMVHEFGHFAAARLCGIEVKEFSLGFGPPIFQRVSKKTGTAFSLRPIPLGGYCMFYGDMDDDPDGKVQDDPRAYDRQPVWKRMISVVAGPLMNFVLAFLVALMLMTFFAKAPDANTYIHAVYENSPAMEAGLQPGDKLLTIHGDNVEALSAQDIVGKITGSDPSQPIPFTVLREGEIVPLEIQLRKNEDTGTYLIGVEIAESTRRLRPGEIIPEAWESCVYYGGAIIRALGKMVTTGEGFNESAGPIGIVQMVSTQTQQYGFMAYLELLVLISINLGLMNLLPIPGLDGSRLVFQLIELIRGKPVNRKVETVIYLIGYAFLIGLMLLFTFKDVLRLFGK
ncbi:MAG: RIP metalloprotease RseP [Clostridia bacterium]|nr:RIP metalloprotease RseP [Clostridia bacterium]